MIPFEICRPYLPTMEYEDPETGEIRTAPTPWSLRVKVVVSIPLSVSPTATEEEVTAMVEEQRTMYEDMVREQIRRIIKEDY